MNLVKKGNIPEAEDSFKEAASLADSVVDEIAKDVIQTQVIISYKFKNFESKPTLGPELKITISFLIEWLKWLWLLVLKKREWLVMVMVV